MARGTPRTGLEPFRILDFAAGAWSLEHMLSSHCSLSFQNALLGLAGSCCCGSASRPGALECQSVGSTPAALHTQSTLNNPKTSKTRGQRAVIFPTLGPPGNHSKLWTPSYSWETEWFRQPSLSREISINRGGGRNRPKFIMILVMGTPNMGPLFS